MKLSFSTVMYEKSTLTYPEIVDRASALGYEGIELKITVAAEDYRNE
jgi:sugar phosphate isomerase/epimerase